MKNVSDSLDEIMSKLEEIQTFLEGPKMWDHDCPSMGTERMSTEVGSECNWCGMEEHLKRYGAYVYRSRS
jgi:hypothetical protein